MTLRERAEKLESNHKQVGADLARARDEVARLADLEAQFRGARQALSELINAEETEKVPNK